MHNEINSLILIACESSIALRMKSIRTKMIASFYWRKHFSPSEHRRIKAFFKLFPYRYNYLYRWLQGSVDDTWLSADERWRLADSAIAKSISLKSEKIYGCRFGKETWFAVIDIDFNGQYHNLESINKLRAILKQAGLKCVVYQSSESGGWHLYIPFGQAAAEAREVRVGYCYTPDPRKL